MTTPSIDESRFDRNTSAIRGATLAWTENGSGPVAVWAHPFSTSSWAQEQAGMFNWSPVSEAGHRLIRYDARGHGRSTGTPDADDYRFANLAADLLALLDELSPDAPVAGIGSSMGTATLLHAAVQAPSRFDRLILTATPTAWETREAQAAIYNRSAEFVEKEGAAAFDAMVAKAPVPRVFQGHAIYPLPLAISEDVLPSVLRGVGASDLPAREEIAKLELPVLILAWRDDSGHPVSSAEELARLISGSTLQIAESLDEVRTWGTSAARFLNE